MAGIRGYARDRRWVAIHEAGHVLAARHFGADAWGVIWPVEGRWTGCTEIPTVDIMPADQRRVIGLAGSAALIAWLGAPPGLFFSMNVGMSASDWALVGLVPVAVLRESLVSTLAMLARERPALVAASRQIIVESRR